MEPSSFAYERNIMNNSKIENDSKDYENFKSFDIG